MRYLIAYTWLLLGFTAFSQKPVEQKPLSNANIQIAGKQHEFGDIVQGQSVSHKFTFTNTGSEPLIILQVQTNCGCTAPASST